MSSILNFKFKISNFESKKGGVVIPLLIGLGVVAVVLGIMVIGGTRQRSSPLGVAVNFGVTRIEKKFFLTINSPQDGATVSQNKATVSGKTFPGTEVSVNEKELMAASDGNFSSQIELEEGENFILVTAGNETGFEEKEIVVYYEK